jgi:lipopolysaccharide assembly outer membrane protein LptD (OstA)
MLPFLNGRAGRVIFFGVLSLLLAPADFAQQPKKHKKAKGTESPSQSAPANSSTGQVPLPIGHEAKGLVLPDIDENGHLRGRFVAGTAKRIDQNHMQFRDLNITTYSDDNKIDLQIAMADSVLDLNTRVLTSPQRTTIKRADFEIAGDAVQFDTAKRHGTMTGNVKMVITDQSKLRPQQSPQPSPQKQP